MRFSAGLSTTFLTLRQQNEFSQVRGVEVRALTDYNITVANLQRAISTTLTSSNIDINFQFVAPDSIR